MKITNIPAELVADILELANEPLIHTRVCWLFNQVATPILYRKVHLYRHYNGGRRVNDIYLFLRTIISRPVLGQCVRHLLADPYHATYDTSFTLDVDDLPRFVAEAASHGLSLEAQQAIAGGSISAMLFLLLFYLPLQDLVIRVPGLGRSTRIFYEQMLVTSPFPSALQSVRSAKLAPWTIGGTRVSWEMIAPFFRLPSLQRFSCTRGFADSYDSNDSNDTPNPLPGSSRVEHIEFLSSTIHKDTLCALIRSLHSLRTFIYEFAATATVTFDPPSLGNALRQHALNTLERLEVTNISNVSTGLLGPLSDFVCLTHIKVSFSLLLDAQDGGAADFIAYQLSAVLPYSIVSLSLLIDSTWQSKIIVLAMERFVKNRRERLEDLQSIEIVGNFEQRERETLELLSEEVEGLEILVTCV
jgi:hypothetical protein